MNKVNESDDIENKNQESNEPPVKILKKEAENLQVRY